MDRYYKVFKQGEEVTAPYVEVRVLSNGDKIGKYYGAPIDGCMTNREIIEYINEHHVEENVEEL